VWSTLGVSVILCNHRPLHPNTVWSNSYLYRAAYQTDTASTSKWSIQSLWKYFTIANQREPSAASTWTTISTIHMYPLLIHKSRRSTTRGSRRTLKILTFTSVAYFTFWSPYVVIVLAQSFVSSFQPPSGVEFAVMWLANTNSAVNVFIYSSTNTQFRRQCVRLASRLCCFRLLSCRRSNYCCRHSLLMRV